MKNKEDLLKEKLDLLEMNLSTLPTRGISFFFTMALPEDDKGANKELINKLIDRYKNSSSDQLSLIKNATEDMRYIRENILENQALKKLLDEKISSIQEKLAVDLIVYEKNLNFGGNLKLD
jgi:hypothetical protein